MSSLDELKAKYAALGKEIKKLEEDARRNKIWLPEANEKYYAVNMYTESVDYTNNSDFDKLMFRHYNVFRTADEAKMHGLRFRIMNILWTHHDGGALSVSLHDGMPTVGTQGNSGLYPRYSSAELSRHVSSLVIPLFEKLNKGRLEN